MKIRQLRQKKDPPSVMRIIDRLTMSDVWGERMRGKLRRNWERGYYRWLGLCRPKTLTPCK